MSFDESEFNRSQFKRVSSNELTFTNFSVSIAFAVEKNLGSGITRTPTASTGSRKGNAYRRLFNVEYNLHPTNPEYTFKIDVIIQSTANGIVARIYNEKLVAKNKAVWEHNNSIWIAFQHQHSIPMNNEFLDSISNHVVKVKISSSKNKCSKAAQSDNTRHFVMPKLLSCEDTEDRGGTRPFIFNEINKFIQVNTKYSQEIDILNFDVSAYYDFLSNRTTSYSSEESNNSEECTVEVKLSPLLAGHSFNSERLKFTHKQYNDVFVSINVDKTLIDDENKSTLYPLVLRLDSLSNLPNQPHSYEELRMCSKLCYVSFQAFGKSYKSMGRLQERNIIFNEYFVFLLGLRAKEDINNFISTPLIMEIHDRDSNKEKIEYVHCDLLPELPKYSQETPNPFGVATFDFTKELYNNCKHILLRSFVTNCSAPPISPLNLENKLILKSANYIECSTDLKIGVRVLFSFKDFVKNTSLNEEKLYKRIVICMETAHFSHEDVIGPVLDHNYQYLSQYTKSPHKLISSFTSEMIDILETIPERNDLVSGFYVSDTENTIVLFEGLIDGFLEGFQKQLSALRSLYNAKIILSNSLAFFKRMYLFWRLDFEPINLFRPLSEIIKQPLLYVRDMIPTNCFKAISKLNIMVQSDSMKCLVRNKALPLLKELESLNKEFGIPSNERKHSIGVACLTEVGNTTQPTLRKHVAIDNTNPNFDNYLKLKYSQIKNFSKINKKNIRKLTKKKAREFFRLNTGCQISPYSLQRLNCHVETLNALKTYLKQKYGDHSLFSYNSNYHGNTWEEGEPKRIKKIVFRKQDWTNYVKPTEMAKVTDSRHEEINSKWEENFYNNEYLRPVLMYRNNYSGDMRGSDFDVWTRFKVPKYEKSIREENVGGKEDGEEKLPSMKHHRLNVRTENIEAGRHAACQIDKLVGLNKRDLVKTSTVSKQDSYLFDSGEKYDQDMIWMNKYFNKFISLQPGDYGGKSIFFKNNTIPKIFEKERPYLKDKFK